MLFTNQEGQFRFEVQFLLTGIKWYALCIHNYDLDSKYIYYVQNYQNLGVL